MKAFFFSIWIFTATSGVAQTIISGVISNTGGEPIALANISIQGTYDGTSSGSNGSFEFVTRESGIRQLRVSFMGFREFTREVVLSGEKLSLTIQLEEEFKSLDAVVISAGAFTAGDNGRKTIFRAVDIATTAGATADIAGALNTLPGTQKVGESGRLFVRGGEGNEARTFIDGLMVLDAYNPSAPNAPSRGRFLPFMFKGISFSTGGYSAEYGQALSSALVLESKDKAELTRTDFGILSVGADAGHTHSWDRGSVGGKVQYTNIRPYFGLINQEIDWITPPASIEGSGAFRHKVGSLGMVKVFGNFSQSDFSLYQHDIDNDAYKKRYDLANHYGYLNGFYKNVLNKNWMMRGGFSHTRIRNKVRSGSETIDKEEDATHAKAVAEGSLSEKVEIRTGVEIIDRSYGEVVNNLQTSVFRESIAAGFAEVDAYANGKFVTRGGLRMEYNHLTSKIAIDPRISLAYRTGSLSQVSFSYGTFRQSVKNDWLKVDHRLESEKAIHYILNYQYQENNKTLRIEGYYKRYSNLLKITEAPVFTLSNAGYGFAKGIEVFWRDDASIKDVDYWISYSFLHTKRNYLDFPVEATPAFASGHNISVVYKHFISSLQSQLGLTHSYASGRPYNNPNDNRFNKGLTPAYQDLSFNWSYLPTPSLIIYFSCTNLLMRDNIFGYEYSQNLNEEGLYNARAIRAPARNFLFLGIFLTLSKERSVNQLPNL